MIAWRKSSFSDGQGACVAVAELDHHVLLCNSNRPNAGTLAFQREAVAAFIADCAAGELDDLG